MLNRAALLLFVVTAVGCAPETRMYSVSVRNDAGVPVTVDLTKDGPPNEEAWASPEDIADGKIAISETTRLGFNTLQPGATETAKNIPGQFKSNTHALLRVYRGGNLQVRDMLVIKPGPNRQDVVLNPGNNDFVVRDKAGQLSVDPVAP